MTGLALIAGVAGMSMGTTPIHAETPGVEALLNQAKYWRSKGREDLAQQALRRARKLAPDSAEVRKAASNVQSAPQPSPAPTAAGAKATATNSAPARARPSSQDRAGRARMAGFDALEDGALQNAAAQFKKALAANRNDAAALGGLGLVMLRQERFAEASNLLEQASRYGKSSQWAEGLASARYFAGLENARNLLATGKVGEAQAEAEQLVRSNYAEPAPALELLADIYERQGRPADAADLYQQASEGGGKNDERLMARAARGRALAAMQRGDDMTAEREFQSGLLMDRSDPWIRYEFARFMIKRNRVAEVESLVRSLTVSGQPESLYAAALINRDLSRVAAAEQLIDQIPQAQRTAPMRNFAVELKIDSAIVRSRELAQAGGQAEAMAALRQLGMMRNIPTSKKAAIADAMLDLGDAQSASYLAASALDDDISQLDDYEGLIRVLAATGRDDLARMALQRAGQLAGGTADGQLAYARMSASLAVSQADRARIAGRFAESFDMLQTAWNASPENADVLSALARLYQTGNMPARAAQTFQLVLARDATDKDALLGLALTAQIAGDRSLSERAQADVLRAFPRDYEVRISLAQVEQARGNDGAALKLLKQARELYLGQNGQSAGLIAGGNPFASMDPAAGNNPFRQQAQVQPVNPFALGSGTRVSSVAVGYPVRPDPRGNQYYGENYNARPSNPAGMSQWQQPSEAMAGWGSSAGSQTYGNEPAQGGYAGSAMAAATPYSSDPVMARIQNDISSLSQDRGPRAEFETSYRNRSGEKGLSGLDEVAGTARISTDAIGGRVYAQADAIVIDAGRPTGSGLARFGQNATIEAQSIVDEVESALEEAETQHRSGVAFAVGYHSDLVQAEVGSTPIGMRNTKVTFHASVKPRLSENTVLSAWAERKPVTDSVVSYAGTRDPVTGAIWGQVMRTGGGMGFSYDRDGSGFYAEGRYNRYKGTNVRSNEGFEANVGGYLRAHSGQRSSLTVGLNLNYQSFDNNQNYFTYGHGGYFSPHSFLSVGAPVRYKLETDVIELNASVTPGFQSYDQEETVLYPTSALDQANLDSLKALNSDVRSYYDSLSKTGLAISADASLYYKASPTTRIGSESSYNSFGDYSEFRTMLGVRQAFGGTE